MTRRMITKVPAIAVGDHGPGESEGIQNDGGSSQMLLLSTGLSMPRVPGSGLIGMDGSCLEFGHFAADLTNSEYPERRVIPVGSYGVCVARTPFRDRILFSPSGCRALQHVSSHTLELNSFLLCATHRIP
jgi:hypothetical protein